MIKVAVVEDDQGVRCTLERIIRTTKGFICGELCESGEEALERLPQHTPDIVLMDINMTGIDGIETTARLKALLPELDVMIITVYEDEDNVFKALQAGACGYILKSSSANEIRAAVKEVASGGAPMSTAIARKVVAAFQRRALPQAESAELDLTSRDTDIMRLLSQGYSNKEIATQLDLSTDTICWFLKGIYKKLHVHSRTEAVIRFKGLQ